MKRLLLAAVLACAPLAALAAPNLGGVWKIKGAVGSTPGPQGTFTAGR